MANPLVAGTWQLSVQGKISGAQISPQSTGTLASIPNPTTEAVIAMLQSLSFGTASGKCDIFCAAAFAIAASGSLTLDVLTGTDFKNLFGGTAAMVKLKGIVVGIPSGGGGDTNGVRIGSTTSGDNALTMWFGSKVMTWTVKPSGAPLVGGDPDGVTVDSTHKNLILTNGSSSAAVTVAVALAGASA